MKANCKISFPRFGNYNIAIEILMKLGLECDYIDAPLTTKKTLEIEGKPGSGSARL